MQPIDIALTALAALAALVCAAFVRLMHDRDAARNELDRTKHSEAVLRRQRDEAISAELAHQDREIVARTESGKLRLERDLAEQRRLECQVMLLTARVENTRLREAAEQKTKAPRAARKHK